MKFTVEREHLLKPLQQVSGPLGGRPTLPILGNLLLQVADGIPSLTGTDLEMEMVARVTLQAAHELVRQPYRRVSFLIFAAVCRKALRLPCSWKVSVCWSVLAQSFLTLYITCR
jgi:DNA polymerase III sliding clamp (beta) subunit (PCNA family)